MKSALIALVLATATVVAGVWSAPSARAATTATFTRPADPNTPVLITDRRHRPTGYRLGGAEVLRIAAADATVRRELPRWPKARAYVYTKGPGRWQVSYFSHGTPSREVIQLYISDATGAVTEAWTGFQVAWSMARGYAGAFGRRVTSLFVWLPLCLLFFAAFVPRPRRFRRAGDGGWSMLHVDLAVLLAFSISLAFFDHANLGISVPLVTPCLVYLLGRAVGLAFGRGLPRGPLPLLVPASWLAVAVVFLVGFRVGLNIADSNVIDVGYAGVIGAEKLTHGAPLYGGWPADNAAGDTYGPVDYYAYVPAYLALGWSGLWDDLPAAHATAIAFDLLTMLGLFLLGRSIRGPTLGVVLTYAWAAYPFTLYALSSNTNDSLVALLIVLALLLVRWAPARGAAAALAGFAKFAPLLLAPLFLRGTEERPRPRGLITYVAAFAATAVVVMLPVILGEDLSAFWHDTVVYQLHRPAPFSPWGLYGGLAIPQHLVQAAAVGLAIAAAFVPRRRTVITVAALAAAIMILVQLTLSYWFYLYIPWFFAPLAVALLGAHPAATDLLRLGTVPPAAAPARSSQLASAS